MLTAQQDTVPNPYKNCIRDILSTLVCLDNDFRRVSAEIRNAQAKFEDEMGKIQLNSCEFRKNICDEPKKAKDFRAYVAEIDEVTNCFTSQIEALKNDRQQILDNARKCLADLNTEKCKFKKFHEKTIDHLKRSVINSHDPKIIGDYEKDICEMHKLFVKEVSFIKNTEAVLLPFFQQLDDADFHSFCNCCCFKNYEWIPQGKSLTAVVEAGNEIKYTMGNVLAMAFGQLHIHQPIDKKSFLAAYLTKISQNEELLWKKLNLFGDM